jgi:hypothetical protein
MIPKVQKLIERAWDMKGEISMHTMKMRQIAKCFSRILVKWPEDGLDSSINSSRKGFRYPLYFHDC